MCEKSKLSENVKIITWTQNFINRLTTQNNMIRRFNRIISCNSGLLCALMISMFVLALYSCSSYSVRDIRENKKSSKRTKAVDNFKLQKPTKAEVKENTKLANKLLSEKSAKIDFVLPNMLGSDLDSVGTPIVSEQIILNNWKQSQLEDAQKSDTSNLSAILKRTRGANVSERNGVANTGFIVHVPKDLLSNRSQLTISPQIIFNNDSIIELEDIIIRGSAFASKQAEGYKEYEKYAASIVGKNEYDEKFLDHAAVERDLKAKQDALYSEYYKDWKKQMAYEKWKEEREDADSYGQARKIGYRKEAEYEARRAASEESERRLAQGKDTSGIYARYMNRFEKKYAKYPKDFGLEKLAIEDVPKEFRDMYLADRQFSDLNNKLLTKDDSLGINKARYKYDQIAVNERRDSLKEERMHAMIPYPYRKDVLLDTIFDGTQDFVFYYPHMTRLPQGVASYKLKVDNTIDIFGAPSYKPASDDLITYNISSLNDLIKPELETKGTKVLRNMYTHITIYPKFESGKSDFKIRYQDNREQIERLKEEYTKYIQEPGYILDSVVMQTTSSLDGTFMYNWNLSDKRGQALKQFISSDVFSTLDVENIFRHTFKGEDWNTLVAKIKGRQDMPNKDAILSILGEVATLEDTDNAERNIKRNYKNDYKIMQDSIYPLLRKTAFVFFMHRPGMEVEEEMRYTTIEGYQVALQQMRERKYWDAIKLLSQNPDFNTALCLMGMGEDQKAYDLLLFLDKDPDVNYLLAIAAYRLGYDNEAIEALKAACADDPKKIERIPYDPEIVQLIKKYKL